MRSKLAIKPATAAPIGIFDSGVGGLTVAKAILKQLPNERLIYLGDTARAPYGTKAGKTVARFAVECVNYLMQYKIKALVVACNTASAYALPALRERFGIPILGVIQPGSKRAAAETPNGSIGVIGTSATIHSGAYPKALRQLAPGIQVFTQACPLFVPLVEEGWIDNPVTHEVARIYLHELIAKRISSLILGCTHYPILKNVIAAICGSEVKIVDSAETVSQELSEVLAQRRLLQTKKRSHSSLQCLVTDIPDAFIRVGQRILGSELGSVRKVRVMEVT
jgi:glutamate racemase